MAKPHIKRSRYLATTCWECVGDGLRALGHSPREAFAQWIWAWHCRDSNPNRAGWEIG